MENSPHLSPRHPSSVQDSHGLGHHWLPWLDTSLPGEVTTLASAVLSPWLPRPGPLSMLTVPRLGQGLLFSTAEILKVPLDLVRLWLHEAERVYGDKMVDGKDQETLRRVTIASTKKFFDVSRATESR